MDITAIFQQKFLFVFLYIFPIRTLLEQKQDFAWKKCTKKGDYSQNVNANYFQQFAKVLWGRTCICVFTYCHNRTSREGHKNLLDSLKHGQGLCIMYCYILCFKDFWQSSSEEEKPLVSKKFTYHPTNWIKKQRNTKGNTNCRVKGRFSFHPFPSPRIDR